MSSGLASTTTTLLLQSLLDAGNTEVWQEFDARYRPIIIGVARRLGLSPEDAADSAQETLAQFVRDYRGGRYDRDRGRLRAWLIGIARHRILDLQRARARQRDKGGHTELADVPDEARLSEIWEVEHERMILCRAMSELREGTRTSPNTLRAFEMLVIEERPAEHVATECGMQVAEVYRIKHRLTKRLREIVERLNRVYEAAGA